jgi:hypothetical protein
LKSLKGNRTRPLVAAEGPGRIPLSRPGDASKGRLRKERGGVPVSRPSAARRRGPVPAEEAVGKVLRGGFPSGTYRPARRRRGGPRN